MRLSGKVAIVTGGGSGFGAEICRKYQEEGAQVAVLDVNEAGGKAVAAEIGGRFFRCDVSKREEVAAAVYDTLMAYEKIDVYVNNAGITHKNKPLLDIEEQWFDKIFAVNVKAIFLSALEVVPIYRKQGGGAIINIASTAGVRPRPGLVVYNSSKGAAITMTRALAIELAPDNIRVNAINPVAGETPLLKEFMGGDTPELREKFRSSVPLGRLSTPRDIANTAAFLASDEAAFLTGIAIEVDGGRCI
ncbi:MAG: glucose 1-dehydrogenase [Vulcanimicrobiaceae bacterium]